MANQQTTSKLKLIFRLIPVVGLLCILIGFGMAVKLARFNSASYTVTGLGALLFLTLFLKAEVANLRYYLHVFIYSVMVFGICVVGYLFARQYTKKVDLTESKIYSLSELSAKYLKKLDKEVSITIFALSPDPFREVIDLYKAVTDKIKWNVIDARSNPLEARKLGDTVRNGDIFIKSGAKSKKIAVAELQGNFENALTNAIVEVTRTKPIKIYFLTGHGEIAYEQTEAPVRGQKPQQASLGAFRGFLSQRAIDTAQLDLAKTGNVPSDAAVVGIAGPRSDLFAPEAAALTAYLGKNGKLLVLLDLPSQQFSTKQPNLIGLLKNYSVEAPEKIVLDMLSAQLTRRAERPLVAWFDKEHPITKELGGRPMSLILTPSRPVQAALEATQGLKVTELIKTGEASWSEDLSKLAAGGRLQPPPKNEMKPQSLAVAVSKSTSPPPRPGMPSPPEENKGGMRLVVFGNSELIQDSFLMSNNTAVELMLNTINWLSEQEDMIAVPPRQLKGTPIVLEAAQLRVIFFFAAVLIPAALFFGGVSYSMMRRRR
jgi:ABC-type uncharacterized transport system involved in gliding motility auxiliary subunit